MKFNIEKCRVMHIDMNNDNVEYFMNGVELSVTNTEKDLGVMISDDLKPSNQCSSVAEDDADLLKVQEIVNLTVCKEDIRYSRGY